MIGSEHKSNSFDSKTESCKIMMNHIALHVSNITETGKFYEEVMQLKLIPEPFKDGLHLWFQIGVNNQLHLIETSEKVVLPKKTTHFSFCVESMENFITHLDLHNIEYGNFEGAPKIPTVRGDGIKQIFFQDPNGYWIEVNDDYPN